MLNLSPQWNGLLLAAVQTRRAARPGLCGKQRSTLDSVHLSPQATAPNSAPTAAVTAIASAPQNVTRHAPISMSAPPTRAAMTPSDARNASDIPDTQKIRPHYAANAATSSGKAAPTEKLAAEAKAACTGRALSVSEMPSSSRA